MNNMAKGALPFEKPLNKVGKRLGLGNSKKVDPVRSGKNIHTEIKNERKDFTISVRRSTLLKQKALCAICHKFVQTWDFDHKDDDRGNFDASNCQALCPTCHGMKTRTRG